jgi:FAD/FMN-containing dehydrogenase
MGLTEDEAAHLSRRAFAQVTVAAASWLAVGQIAAGTAAAAAYPVPTGFPGDLSRLTRTRFRNWCGEVRVDDLWSYAPTSAQEIVTLANWARRQSYRLRATGYRHAWPPYIVEDEASASAKVILLDMTAQLTKVTVGSGRVRTQPGATIDAVLTALRAAGRGLAGYPAIGQVSIGGVLAVDGHGAGVPADGETPLAGQGFGSLSNLVLELTAVVWNESTREYALRTFQRTDPAISPLLVSLGRSVITEVVLRTAKDQRLRCQSFTDIPWTELYAAPGSPAATKPGARTFSSLIGRSGRVDAVWAPFTDNPWVHTWTIAPTKPAPSREVRSPYNYPFTDRIPPAVSHLATSMVSDNPSSAPLFGQLMQAEVTAGLLATHSSDLWGWSKDVMVWTRATSLPTNDFGLTVLCRRRDIQARLSKFVAGFVARRDAWRALSRYPINMPLHVRVSGLDEPSVAGRGARLATLSAISPRPDHPEWDTAVWFNLMSLPGTPDSFTFCAELESWATSRAGFGDAVRVEWSKDWAYSPAGPWTDADALAHRIPDSLSVGRVAAEKWAPQVAELKRYDPYGVFNSDFLDRLLRREPS